MNYAPTRQGGRREYQKSGFHKRKRRINRRGLDGIDARTVEGRDALRWRDNEIRDLGGADNVSTAKAGLVDVATGERYLWRSGWAFIMQEQGGSKINKRKKAFYPIVKDVLDIGEKLARHLKDIGLERQAKTISLEQYVAEKYGNRADGESGAE